jgi:hypothetical protein
VSPPHEGSPRPSWSGGTKGQPPRCTSKCKPTPDERQQRTPVLGAGEFGFSTAHTQLQRAGAQVAALTRNLRPVLHDD